MVFPEQPRAGLSVRAYLVALFSLRPAPAGGRLPPPPSARWWEPFPPLVGSDIRVSKLWYPLNSKRSRAASRTPLTWVKTRWGGSSPPESAPRPGPAVQPLLLTPPGCWGDPSTMEQCPHEAASDSARQDRVSTCPWDVTARKGVMAGKTGPWPVVQNRHYSSGSDPSRADSPSTTPVLAQSDQDWSTTPASPPAEGVFRSRHRPLLSWHQIHARLKPPPRCSPDVPR